MNIYDVGPDDASKEFELGILYVHGIGEQKQGQSLVNFADSVFTWFHRWLGHDEYDGSLPRLAPGGLAIKNTRLLPPQEDPHSPAHSELHFESNGDQERKWLIAESWWARVFEPPKFRGLAMWLLTLAPQIAILQSSAVFRGALDREAPLNAGLKKRLNFKLRRAGSLFGGSVFFVASSVLALVVEVAVLLLLLVTLLPIPFLRRFATKLGLAISASIGDSFVLSASPSGFDAMVEQVQRDLEWVVLRAKRVCVVGHSQGAAIAHEALRDSTPKPVKLFLTLGSGLRRLYSLRASTPVTRAAWILLVVAAAVLVRWILSPWIEANPLLADLFSWGFLGGGFVGSIFVTYQTVLGSSEEAVMARRYLPLPKADLTWIDYYGTADPVSNGPTIENSKYLLNTERKQLRVAREERQQAIRRLDKVRKKGRSPRVVEQAEKDLVAKVARQQEIASRIRTLSQRPNGAPKSVAVYNRASFVRDHSFYLKNEEQLVSNLVYQFFAQTDQPLSDLQEPFLNEASDRRDRRLRRLNMGRVILIGALLVGGGISVKQMPSWGDWLARHTPELVVNALQLLALPLDPLLSILRPYRDFLLGAAVWLLGVAVIYGLLVSTSWALWNNAEVSLFFKRDSATKKKGHATAFGILSVLAGIGILVAGFFLRAAPPTEVEDACRYFLGFEQRWMPDRRDLTSDLARLREIEAEAGAIDPTIAKAARSLRRSIKSVDGAGRLLEATNEARESCET